MCDSRFANSIHSFSLWRSQFNLGWHRVSSWQTFTCQKHLYPSAYLLQVHPKGGFWTLHNYPDDSWIRLLPWKDPENVSVTFFAVLFCFGSSPTTLRPFPAALVFKPAQLTLHDKNKLCPSKMGLNPANRYTWSQLSDCVPSKGDEAAFPTSPGLGRLLNLSWCCWTPVGSGEMLCILQMLQLSLEES